MYDYFFMETDVKITGAKMVIEALKLEGVETVFGYPGGAIMNVYDEIYKQTHFKHILTRHEQAAVHAADGYARASGKVGVAIVTSGPGFTNAVTGLATAYMDSIPLVVISGQVPSHIIGTDGFQEIDAVGISRPCTKHNYLVQNADELPKILKEAFYIAASGRPGPVHVDIPKDVTANLGTFDYSKEVNLPTYKPTIKGNKRQMKKAIEALSNSSRPLLYIGGGAILGEATDEIRKFAKTYGIPAVETLMARGAMSDANPLFFGMLGMHGEYAANMAMHETDLIISLGARFDDRVTGRLDQFGKNAHIVHVDVDPASIAKIVSPHYPIVGQLKSVMQDLIDIAKEFTIPSFENWKNKLDAYRSKEPLRYMPSSEVLKPQWVIEAVSDILGEDAIITTDVGQHQMWAAQFYKFTKPRQWVTSGGLGTMGYGLPAAMGVAKAMPNKISVNFTGDGSILMNVQELTTCVENKLQVINIILNNNFLGMVRQWQTMFYDDRLSETDLSSQPDFVKVAEAFGGFGARASTKEEFKKALQDAIESKKVAFIDVIIDRRENVLPMVPNGHALNEMYLIEE